MALSQISAAPWQGAPHQTRPGGARQAAVLGLLALSALVALIAFQDVNDGLEGLAKHLAAPWLLTRGACLALLVWLAATHGSVRRRLSDWPFFVLLALVAVAALSGIQGRDPQTSFTLLLRELGFYAVAVGLVLAVVDRPSRLRVLLWVISVVAGLQAVFAILIFHLVLLFPHWAEPLLRLQMVYMRSPGTFAAVGTFEVYSVMTRFLAMGLGCQALLWALGARGRGRHLLVLLAAVTVWAIVLGMTRTTWIAVAMGILTYALLGNPRVLLWLAIAPVLLGAVAPQAVQDRMQTVFDVGLWRDPASNVGQRVAAMQAAVAMLQSSPVLGIGYGRHLFERHYEEFAAPGAPEGLVNAHNNLLEFAAETGLVGAGLYAALCLGLLAMTFRRLLGAEDRRVRRVFATLLAVQVMLHVEGLAQFTWKGEVGVLVVIMLALVMVLARNPHLAQPPQDSALSTIRS